uniref:Uncharacterized protein n=1 Tax=Picea sitchensis TaxID=3332 RepID=D5ADD7_PICSI|nr:unknown [Picea sitchensis]
MDYRISFSLLLRFIEMFLKGGQVDGLAGRAFPFYGIDVVMYLFKRPISLSICQMLLLSDQI